MPEETSPLQPLADFINEELRIGELNDEQLLEELRHTHFEKQTYDLLIDEVERRELDI